MGFLFPSKKFNIESSRSLADSAQLESGSVRILGKAVMCQFRIN